MVAAAQCHWCYQKICCFCVTNWRNYGRDYPRVWWRPWPESLDRTQTLIPHANLRMLCMLSDSYQYFFHSCNVFMSFKRSKFNFAYITSHNHNYKNRHFIVSFQKTKINFSTNISQFPYSLPFHWHTFFTNSFFFHISWLSVKGEKQIVVVKRSVIKTKSGLLCYNSVWNDSV